MITLFNGDKYRTHDGDVTELKGYTLEEDEKTFTQNFLPCKYRYTRACPTCAGRPSCRLKSIDSFLVCVDCSERDNSTGSV